MNRKTPSVTQCVHCIHFSTKFASATMDVNSTKKAQYLSQSLDLARHWEPDFTSYVPVNKELATCSIYTPLAYWNSKTYRLHI